MRHAIAVLALASAAHAQVFVGEEYERRVQFEWTSQDFAAGGNTELAESYDPGAFSAAFQDFETDPEDYILLINASQDSVIDGGTFWASGKCGYSYNVGFSEGAHMDLSASSSAFFLFELDVDAPAEPFRLTATLDVTQFWNVSLVVADEDGVIFESTIEEEIDEMLDLSPGVFYSIEVRTWGDFFIDDELTEDYTFGDEGLYEVHLEQLGCDADVNGDGSLDILDFVAFQQLWQTQAPEGDCDANGVFNILDFVCFQQRFVQGCP